MADSFIQIPLPNDKSVYELMNLENTEKIKAIEIGISAVKLINDKKLRYENSEYNEKLNETEEKYKAIIKNFKEQLNNNIEENIKLQENFAMEKKKLHKSITENIELQYVDKLNHKQVILIV